MRNRFSQRSQHITSATAIITCFQLDWSGQLLVVLARLSNLNARSLTENPAPIAHAFDRPGFFELYVWITKISAVSKILTSVCSILPLLVVSRLTANLSQIDTQGDLSGPSKLSFQYFAEDPVGDVDQAITAGTEQSLVESVQSPYPRQTSFQATIQREDDGVR